MKVSSLPKVNSAKVSVENRAFLHPLCCLGEDLYLLLEGWKLVGWTSAPYAGSGKHAIVYERLTPDPDNVFEVGKLYWCHGTATKMDVRKRLPAALKDELEPWL
jgi:hypothetical protein